MKINNGGSNFRHRDDGQGLLKDFSQTNNQNNREEAINREEQISDGDPEVRLTVSSTADYSIIFIYY